MTILHSIFLGIIQGLTEFIPVSSTAHLLISQHLLGLAANREMFIFTVLVQLGTLLSLIVFYWNDLWRIARAWFIDLLQFIVRSSGKLGNNLDARMGWYLIIGSIPAGLAGVLLKSQVEALFQTPLIESLIRLLLTIVLLLTAEKLGRRFRKADQINWKDALWVGIAQILAVFPGASRSGSTMTGGMLRGLDRPTAARFAFLLSVPVFMAAGVYESLELFLHETINANIIPSIFIGIFTSAIVGYIAIRWLLSFLVKQPLYLFAVYCSFIVLGIAVLLII